MDGETVSAADGLHFAAQIKGYTRFSLKPVIDFRRTLDQLCSGSAAGGEMIRGGNPLLDSAACAWRRVAITPEQECSTFVAF